MSLKFRKPFIKLIEASSRSIVHLIVCSECNNLIHGEFSNDHLSKEIRDVNRPLPGGIIGIRQTDQFPAKMGLYFYLSVGPLLHLGHPGFVESGSISTSGCFMSGKNERNRFCVPLCSISNE